jgi:hypothetical protein
MKSSRADESLSDLGILRCLDKPVKLLGNFETGKA